MTEKVIVVKNRAGIHARPAAMIVQTADQYHSRILFKKEHEEVDAKSIMGVITLGATFNSKITISAEGNDEQIAVEAIARLFETCFEEE